MTTESGSPASTPRPGPRPGPPSGSRTVSAVVAPLASDPHRFGRVDDDGTVWLITAVGERQIGSWQAGDHEEAFAHFGRRYDDLSTEVTLLEERLASGTGEARKIKASAMAIAEQLPTANILGDVDALSGRIAAVVEHADTIAAAGRAQRDARRTEAAARKEALAVEAEELAANSTQWKSTGDRLRTIVEEWRAITGVDRKVDEALWKRYAAARDSFNRRRGSHFADLDRGRIGAREDKERLCKRAEELSGSTDWSATSAAFRELLTSWKATGRASKDVDETLWQRFKAAQDTFFAARNAANAQRDAELETNAAAKQELLAEAERIDVTNHNSARAALRSIVTKWEALGQAPRERAAELERRLRAVEKKIRDAGAAAEAAVVDPEAQARAAQFRDRAEQFERQASKAAAAGREKDAAQARASAEQWRQWAQAAEEALHRR